MSKRRTKLIGARIEAGYHKQEDLVNDLRKNGIEITLDIYKNIESGRSKNVDVTIAFAIASKVNRTVQEIFLPDATQKIHQKTNEHSATEEHPNPAA